MTQALQIGAVVMDRVVVAACGLKGGKTPSVIVRDGARNTSPSLKSENARAG
ncbi:hypothetical protein [Lutimaribacter saemankumensis]|uniref:hypothetical protein n=1 Tax=Lutimaribacter saemankumensis TaxID=490829 RepID=UPI001FDEA900|nr:hypothetical protein [Lutimaribacter saemankumensis]